MAVKEVPKYKIELWYRDSKFLHWRWSVHVHRHHQERSTYDYDKEGYANESLTYGARRTKAWAERAARRHVRKLVARDQRIAAQKSVDVYIDDKGITWSPERVEHALNPNVPLMNVEAMSNGIPFTITEQVDTPERILEDILQELDELEVRDAS